MSGYHRLGGYPGHEQSEDDPFNTPHPMDQRYHDRSPSPVPHPGLDPRYTGHSPSPGPHYQPQGFQLQDRPPTAPLEIPVGPGPGPGTPGDRLTAQPTYSVENMPNTYGHSQQYRDSHPISPPYDPHHGTGDLALHPEDHHDGYYNDPYAPTPLHEDPFHVQTDHHAGWHDDADDRPILGRNQSHGTDPYADPIQDEPLNNAGAYMTAAGEPKPAPSPAPPRRFKTVKEVQLFEGNFVLDCPVPPRLLNQIQHAEPPERDEYTHMRYSAVTGDPKDFYQNRFRLRQQLFAKPRHTELFICITMYNEEDELFARTLLGVIKNIEYMNGRKTSKTWGQEAWKKIVVCVVSDGRAKINKRTRAVLAALGCYQEGIAKQDINGEDVTAHVYEYTTQMTLELKKGIVNVKKGNTPVQMLFCLKEKNQKKINSHRWFFQAFGSVLNPNICCLIDAGTRPGKDSIYHLWKAFDIEPKCAGACGEIRAMLEHGKQLINPLVAAQNFEYKMSNILDKPLESVFGFITVLPGAFSAYRYLALQNDKTGQGPLEKYFKGETLHGADADLFTSNMYLAEDRILCFELVAKRNCNWVLQYVKSSEGVTDVPTEIADFIMQRRRWLNGSFFAAVYSTFHFYQIFRSSHSCIRKVMFLFEFLYQFINQLFAWFAIGNFFLVFRILTVSLGDPTLLNTPGRILAVIFEWLYMITLVSCFILALGNRPQGSRKLYFTMVCFWVVLMVYLTFAAIFVVVKSIQQTVDSAHGHFTASVLFHNTEFNTLIVSLVSTYILYFTMSILFLDPWHMFTSFIQYLLLTPMYINILNVYAFCNVHDITWGTKGADQAQKLDSVSANANNAVNVNIPSDDADLNTQYESELRTFASKFTVEKKEESPEEKQADYYKGFRSAVVLVWMFCNLGLAAAVLATGGFERLEQSAPTPSQSSAPQQLLRRQGGGSGGGSGTGGSSGGSSSSGSGSSSSSGTTTTGNSTLVDHNSLIYMQVILYTVAVLSGIRWIGSLWFLVLRVVRGV